MILDNNFDKILGLILRGDKKNRNKIIDFFKSMPNEFILMMRNSLEEYNNYKIENKDIPLIDREYKCFDKQVYDSIGDLYSFSIDTKEDIISIRKSICINGGYHSNFIIELINIDKDMSLFDVNNIGNISYCLNDNLANRGYTYLGKIKNVSYGLMNVSFGSILLSSINNDGLRICGFVDMENEIDLSLDTVSGKLVRTKKRDNRKDIKNV